MGQGIVLGSQLKFANRPDSEVALTEELGQPLILQPGEGGILLAIAPLDENNNLYILMLAVTQHPKTKYTWIYDNGKRVFPHPIGTLINPLYTCREFGHYIVCRTGFAIHVLNEDEVAHTYAGTIGYKAERSVV